MSEQPVNPAQPEPVVDPVQPAPDPKDQPVEDNKRDIPTVKEVDFDNLQSENVNVTPVLEQVNADGSPIVDDNGNAVQQDAQPTEVSPDVSQDAQHVQVNEVPAGKKVR